MSVATCKAFFSFIQNKNLINRLKTVEDLAAAKENHLTEMVRQVGQRLSFTENNIATLNMNNSVIQTTGNYLFFFLLL